MDAKVGGKVKPRRAQLARGAVAAAPALDALPHAARLAGELPGDPPRRYPEELTEGDTRQVSRHAWRDARGGARWRDAIRAGAPAVLVAAPLCGDTSSKFVADHRPGALAAWSWAHLAGTLGGAGGGSLRGGGTPKAPAWPCYLSAPNKDRFIICDDAKNIYGSFYHIREPETEARALSFAEFSACARGWRSRRVLLRARLASHASQRSEDDEEADEQEDSAASTPALKAAPANDIDAAAAAVLPPLARDLPAAAAAELRRLLDWRWLADEVQTPLRCGPVLAVTLVAASPRSLQPARYSAENTLLCQVRGRSRVVLVPPAATFPGAYPFPVAHPYDGYSCVDWEAPDHGAWPAFGAVRGDVAVLGPGDVLFVPRFWWAHVHALGGSSADDAPAADATDDAAEENTCLEVAMAAGGLVRSPAAAAVATSRRVEELVAAGVGAAAARTFLRRVAKGTDLSANDFSTPGGYKQLRLATAVRDEVALSLGLHPLEGVAPFLRAMTDGRMVATPWLNANFREPLYLKDVPLRLPDTRTEWERRFPELFTRKLAAEGYQPVATPVSQMNPLHPQFVGGSKYAKA